MPPSERPPALTPALFPWVSCALFAIPPSSWPRYNVTDGLSRYAYAGGAIPGACPKEESELDTPELPWLPRKSRARPTIAAPLR